MVLELILLGVGIYVIVHKHKDRKEKKRALKAQEAGQHGPVREVSIIDKTSATGQMEDLPAYQNDKLPAYETVEQHPALRANNWSEGTLTR